MPEPAPVHRPWRWPALVLTLAVLAGHLWLGEQLARQWAESGLGAPAPDRRPARINVDFVRQLQPSAPMPVRAVPPAPPLVMPTLARAEAPELAASAPELLALPPVPEPHVPTLAQAEPPASAPTSAPTTDSAPGPGADTAAHSTTTPVSEAAASASAAADAQAFDWPPSTRLSYTLTGNFRGPVDGQAQVQWLRSGTHYQVHLDVGIGPAVAPLISRQMSSDGELGPHGLAPRRYDEHTRVLLRAPRRASIQFGPGLVQLPSGREVPRPPGVQDAVSQFVQLTWRFTLNPGLLVEGQRIELPLALPRRVDTWVYEVRETEVLHTPVGPVSAVRVRPQREARPGGDLVAEMWFAPRLQYLPVRIVIRQDADTYIDLLLDRLPEQGDATAPTLQPPSSPKRAP